MWSGTRKPFSRIAIVGVGQVGGATASALVLASVANEILLVDVNVELRDGQVRDLSDVAFSINGGTRVRAASYREAGQCDIVVITAGSKSAVDEIHSGRKHMILGRKELISKLQAKPRWSSCTEISRLSGAQ